MSLIDLPKGFEPIYSEVKYSDFRTIDEVAQYINSELESLKYINPKDLHFKIEQKLSGYRPGNKYYVGNEIMFIIKYIEPRNGPQHDMVMDKEICILHPQYFQPKAIQELVNYFNQQS